MPRRAATKNPEPRPPEGGWRFYLLLAGVVVLLVIFEALLTSLPFAEAQLSKLSDFQLKELDTYVEMNKLLTTLATLTIGATTGFAINLEKSTGLSSAQIRKAVGSWTLAGVSIYCGHLAYQQVIWMLDKQFFNLFYSHVWWPTRAQFWTFLLAVIVLTDFICGGLRRKAGEA